MESFLSGRQCLVGRVGGEGGGINACLDNEYCLGVTLFEFQSSWQSNDIFHHLWMTNQAMEE